MEQGTDTDEVTPAEVAAIHTDTETASIASGDGVEDDSNDDSAELSALTVVKKPKGKEKVEKKATKTLAKARPHRRSANYLVAAKQVDSSRVYEAKEALRLAQETSYSKFDGAVEIHCRLRLKRGKADAGDRFRMMIALPHGTGRESKIGVLDEALIELIKQKGDTEFDILLASPSLMPKVAQIAKILGPKGKMPNPKTGTVTDDPELARQAILSGRIELKADGQGNLHQTIGRVSWSPTKLLENYQTLVAGLPSHRLQQIVVSATMGPGILVAYEK